MGPFLQIALLNDNNRNGKTLRDSWKLIHILAGVSFSPCPGFPKTVGQEFAREAHKMPDELCSTWKAESAGTLETVLSTAHSGMDSSSSAGLRRCPSSVLSRESWVEYSVLSVQ